LAYIGFKIITPKLTRIHKKHYICWKTRYHYCTICA